MSTLEVESTLTDRYQTTVPEPVRRALRLGKRDRIHYDIRPGGEVVLSRADPDGQRDAVLDRFLEFLAQDISGNPARLQAVDADLAQRLRKLTEDVDLDLDAPLSADNG